jgi:hypothetical protein
MNQPQEGQSTASEPAAHQACPCREIADSVRQFLGIPPAAREHLANSRVEFLKALRAMLDARIEHLSNQPQRGTKVAVE